MGFQTGQLVGNYQVVRLIGEGGFGAVYWAENQLIQRRAALKVLHPSLASDTELVRRFFNEARAATAIRHPNIIDIQDAGWSLDGQPYILMELLEGESLKQRLANRGPLPLSQVLEIARQSGSALAAAHAVGIIHRDLKPENLFMVPDAKVADGERVKVLDFGIAKMNAKDCAAGSVRTQTGTIFGSPAYMSPEQCRDSANVDVRTDIYALTTILYELLAGRTPFVAETPTDLLLLHLDNPPPPLGRFVPGVPQRIEAAIMRGLAQERSERFDRMEDLISALCEALPEPRPASVVDEAIPPGDNPIPYVGRRARSPRSTTTLSRASGEAILPAEHLGVRAKKKQASWWVVAGLGLVALLGAGGLASLREKGGAPLRADSMPSATGHGLTPHAPLGASNEGKAVAPSPPSTILLGAQDAARPANIEPSEKAEPGRNLKISGKAASSRSSKRTVIPDEEWLAH